MSYVNAKTSVSLNPEYFRNQALAYNANPTDRKVWLQKQKINLQAAINQYAAQLQALAEQGAKLDGVSDAGKWLSTIGSVAMVIPTPYTQIGGLVISIAGSIFSASEKKKDSKALQQLGSQARTIQLEMTQIKTYYDNYDAELTKLNLMPIALFATAAFLISNK